MKIIETNELYDFAVIGGGLAGICAALAAARNGIKIPYHIVRFIQKY